MAVVLRAGPLLEGLSASRARIGYVDLCWSADKSVSLAWVFAPTEAERNMIAQAHRDAVGAALLSIESEIGAFRRALLVVEGVRVRLRSAASAVAWRPGFPAG